MENPRLRQAIESAQLGFYDQARIVLLQVIREDPNNELAWLWLAQTLDDPNRQRDCLQQVLRINPNNADALIGAEALHTGRFLPEPGSGTVLASDPEIELTTGSEPELSPDADLYELLDESYYADALYAEEPVVESSAEELTFEIPADVPVTDHFADGEQDEVLESSAIFEMTEPEPVVESVPEPESFLERARRARVEAATPAVVPLYIDEDAAADSCQPRQSEPVEAGDAEPVKRRGRLFERRKTPQTPDADVSLLHDVASPPKKFRLFDRRVLLGILGLAEIPLIALLLFLLLRGGNVPLLGGVSAGKSSRPTSTACKALDLEEFTIVDALGGELTADTAFTGTEVLVTDTIIVSAAQRLLIYPGATLVFTPGATIEVYGTLFACGNGTAPVTFTAVDKTPGGWEGIRLYNPATGSVLSNAVINYAGERALILNGGPVSLGSVKIAHSARFPVSLDGNRVPDLSRGLDLSDNPFQGVEIRPGTLTVASAVWSNYNMPYVVTGLLRVDEAATLDVKPGAVVKFLREPQGQLSGIWVRGLLKAEEAYFTSIHDSSEEAGGATYMEAVDPQPGDWGSITFFQSSAKSYMRNVAVRYGGKSTGAVAMRNSSPELTDVTITDSATYPLSVDVNAFPELRDMTLTGNLSGDVLEIRGGAADPERGEYVWHALGGETPIVRVIRDVLVIGPEATLTVNPGVIVKFGEEGQLIVQGKLAAMGGAATERIIFTSVRDDDFGGDTDGHTSQRDSRAWGGIVFDGADAASVLHNVVVRFAPVTLLNASPKLSGSQIADAPGAGLRMTPDCVPELVSSRFDDNELRGIAILTGTMASDVRWSQIGGARDQIVRILEGEVTVGEQCGTGD